MCVPPAKREVHTPT